jgi:hypothetical protein
MVTRKYKYKTELLDPNHTHFILVDNAEHKFGGEVDFRANLESEIAKGEWIELKSRKKIPIVVIVLGGGPRTAEYVYRAVKIGTPCVFIDVTKALILVRLIVLLFIHEICHMNGHLKSQSIISKN